MMLRKLGIFVTWKSKYWDGWPKYLGIPYSSFVTHTYLASTFSDIKDLVFPKGNRHTGHVTSFGWHSWHTTWPLSHWKTGADLGTLRHTGHSRTSLRSSAEIMGCLAAITLKENDENMTELNWIWNIYLIEWAHYLWRISLLCTFKPLIVLTIWNDFSQKKFWKNFHWREMTWFFWKRFRK